MSAFMVSKKHIDLLVKAGLDHRHPLQWIGESGEFHFKTTAGVHYCRLELNSATTVGQMLWKENLRSIHSRYPDTRESGEMPGPIDLTVQEVESYTFARNLTNGRPDPVVALKAIDCFEYQSSENADWEETEAYRYCEALRRHLITLLPGYEEAAWGN